MNIKTLLCSGLIAVLGVSSVKADSGGNEDEIVTRLTIHLESGSEEHYVFSSIPEITFSGTQMLVSSNSSQTAYERSEVAYFDFTKGPASSIDSTVATDTDCLTGSGSSLRCFRRFSHRIRLCFLSLRFLMRKIVLRWRMWLLQPTVGHGVSE
mgnify:CR=1 FL=1